MENGYQATPHETLIEQIMDSRVPKNEREHAAAREIERLREEMSKMAQYSRPPTDNQTHVVGEVKPLQNGSDVLDHMSNACMTEQVIDEYLCDYTMDGDSEFHMPSESELALIKDAIMGLLVDPNFLAAFAPLTEPELRAGIALQLREIERLRTQVKQADARGDDSMRRAHGAEAQIDALAEAQAFLMTELAAAKEKYAAAQHAADCLEAKCNALNDAAASALYLLKKGVPGWGVAKDILALAIHNTGKQT